MCVYVRTYLRDNLNLHSQAFSAYAYVYMEESIDISFSFFLPCLVQRPARRCSPAVWSRWIACCKSWRCAETMWTRSCWWEGPRGCPGTTLAAVVVIGERHHVLTYERCGLRVKAMLRSYFGKELNDHIDPDITVAYGAASILD